MAKFANAAVLTIGSAVANITNITGPGVSRDMLDKTVHGTTDYYRTFIPGLIDGGEISVEGNLGTAAGGNVLMTLLNNGTKTTGATLVSGGMTWTFNCYVSAFSCGFPHDGLISFSGTIKIDGKPVLT
jgi:hypothetical protein